MAKESANRADLPIFIPPLLPNAPMVRRKTIQGQSNPDRDEVDARILEILIRGPSNPDQIAKELGMRWEEVDKHLSRMQAEGKVNSH